MTFSSSSVAQRIGALGDVGGVNSFNNFAASWSRAANFHELADGVPRIGGQQDEESQGQHHFVKSTNITPTDERRSLLREAIERQGQSSSESPFNEANGRSTDPDNIGPLSLEVERRLDERRSSCQDRGLLQLDAGRSSPFASVYGSFGSPRNESSPRPSGVAPYAPRIPDLQPTIPEEERLLGKQIEGQESKEVGVVVGRSTLPQTVFNSVNTLIGVGMLSLPLAMKYSGWLLGMAFFLFASITTSYTSKLLAKCLDVDPSLFNFADLAYISFGKRARVAISLLFCLELVATCVALVILFADSMNALIQPMGITESKILCGFILVPLAFVPLRYLSFSSFLGIVSCSIIVLAVFVDGLVKSSKPGSLRDPARTFAFPQDWRTLPLAYGLLMAPWGGHSVFPNIYRDMRHPRKYIRAVNTTYIFTYSLEIGLAIIGYLMFGQNVRDVVTSNIFHLPGYPRWIDYLIAIAIGIIPLTKTPLNARPIYTTCEFYLGLSTITAPAALTWKRRAWVVAVRSAITIVFVVIAVFVPSFDRVMALLGSMACSLICIILPCSFHLKIFGKNLSFKQRLLDWSLIAFFTIGGLIGTICTFLPKHLLGAG